MFGNRRGYHPFQGPPRSMDGPPQKFPRFDWTNSYPMPPMRPPPPPMPPPPPVQVSCGELRRSDVGKIVEMTGRLHKLMQDRFVQIKDNAGATQLVIPSDRKDLVNRFLRMPLLSQVTIFGKVQPRPTRTINQKWDTGEIEIVVEDILGVKVFKQAPKLKETIGQKRPNDGPPKITTEEYKKFHGLLPQLSDRQYTCGDLADKLNETVSLICWVERSSRKFVTLADGYGKIQCVLPGNDPALDVAENIALNSVVSVTGVIQERPKPEINHSIVNGHIELHVKAMGWPQIDLDNISNNTLPTSERSRDVSEEVTCRTRACGRLGAGLAGQRVRACGKLVARHLDKFLSLRDHTGSVQCVLTQQVADEVKHIPIGSVLMVEGVLAMRPSNKVKTDIKTGEIEVNVNKIKVLCKASDDPFFANESNIQDPIRLRHRYTDLWSKKVRNNLEMKSMMEHNLRKLLVDKFELIQVDTPTLTGHIGGMSSLKVETPHGEVNYLVRDPYLHFLMLMAGMMDRCFSVTTAYLKEPVEGQLEGRYLKMAVSYADMDKMIAFVETLLHQTCPKFTDAPPYLRIEHADALRMYGTHQPNLLYDLKLLGVTEVMEDDMKTENFAAFCLIYPKELSILSKPIQTVLNNVKNKYSNVKISNNSAGDISTDLEKSVREYTKIETSKNFFLAVGDKDETCSSLGEIRQQLDWELSSTRARPHEARARSAWVTHAPFSHPTSAVGGLAAVHPDDSEQARDDINKARSQSFSLVVNGKCYVEGIIGNTDSETLEKQFSLLQLEAAVAANVRDAIGSGCPPFAYVSIDLNKLAALACDATSMCEIIAFPKSESGQDMMCKLETECKLEPNE